MSDPSALGESIASQVLAHYGVKGMKWGVRKKDTSPTAVTVKQDPGKRVKADGGKNLPASDDAVRAAVARQKAKKSTPDALSNQELQQLVNRLNLEQQYARLTEADASPGVKLAKAFLGDYGKQKFFQYADEAVNGNEELNIPARPKLKPAVDSLRTVTKTPSPSKKKKDK